MSAFPTAESTDIADRPEGWTSDRWATPWPLLRELETRYGAFDLDPCCEPHTAKAPAFYTVDDDGLSKPWFGRVFINPPFSSPRPWCDRAAEAVKTGEAEMVVMLLPCATDTAWFHEVVWPNATLHFLRGRVRFLDGVGRPSRHHEARASSPSSEHHDRRRLPPRDPRRDRAARRPHHRRRLPPRPLPPMGHPRRQAWTERPVPSHPDFDPSDLHDHPWDYITTLLAGAYIEHTAEGATLYQAPVTLTRTAEHAHRLELPDGPVWTLILTGRVRRAWGFYTGAGWEPWQHHHRNSRDW